MLKKGGKLLLKDGGEEEANNQLLLQPKVENKNALSATQSGLPTSELTRTITEIRLEKKVVAVYNLEVANAHTFFVGEDGVLVHNAIPAGCKNMPGVYMFIARSGKVYIGKAKDIAKRLAQHERSGKLPKGNMPTFKPMPGANDLQLSIVEQLNINFHGYAKSDRGILENSINSMSKARQRFYGLIP